MASSLSLGAPNCRACPLQCTKPVPSQGPKSAKLIILGDVPGSAEEQDGKQLAGYFGWVIRGALRYLKIPQGQVYFANALLCRPGRKLAGKEWKQALEACRPRLEHELSQVKAKTIFTIGDKALWLTTGKQNVRAWAGAPLTGSISSVADGVMNSNYTILPADWPRDPAMQWVFRRFLARAWDSARGQLPPWKWPKSHIQVNDAMVAELERLYANASSVGFDTETRGTDPMTSDIMCLGIADKFGGISTPWHRYDSIKYGISPALSEFGAIGDKVGRLVRQILFSDNIEKVMQNAQHDLLAAEYQDLPIKGPIFDTMLAHHAAFPQLKHDLGFIAAIEFAAPRWKSEFKVIDDAKGLDAFVQRVPEDLRLYNFKDAYMTALLR